MGNLARDPDVRFTPNKQKVARITVAIGRQWKNKVTGELQSHTDFIPVVAWGASADLCERYLKKGRPVLVEGRITVRDFDDIKTGQHRWVTEVVAENIVLLSSGRRDDEGSGGYQQQRVTAEGSSPVTDARRSRSRTPWRLPIWAALEAKPALKMISRLTFLNSEGPIRQET